MVSVSWLASVPLSFWIRPSAMSMYSDSSSTLMELRPQRLAATAVLPVPANGSSTVSSMNENIRINRSANSTGYGAG